MRPAMSRLCSSVFALSATLVLGSLDHAEGQAVAALPPPVGSIAGQAPAAVRSAAGGATSADLNDAARDGLQRAIRRLLVDRAVVEPTTGSAQSASQHQLTVVADKGDVLGRARFYIPLNPNVDGHITFSAPLTGGKATFATNEGLGGNVTIGASLKVTAWRKLSPAAARPTSSEFRVLNNAVVGNASQLAALEALRRGAALDPPSVAASVDATRTDATTRDRDLARWLQAPSLTADPDRFYSAIAREMPDLVATRWAAYFTPGFESTRYAVDFLAKDTAASETFTKTASTFTFSAGYSKINEFHKKGDPEEKRTLAPLLYAGLSFKGGGSVSVPDKSKVCRPFGTAGASECFDLPVGVPSTATFTSFTIEYRHWAYDQSLGINPKYTRSVTRPDGTQTDKVVTTFEVPVYFMHQVKDIEVPDVTFGVDLVGGVSVGWRDTSTTRGAFATIFLTKVFGLP